MEGTIENTAIPIANIGAAWGASRRNYRSVRAVSVRSAVRAFGQKSVCVQGSPKQRAAIGAKAIDSSGFLLFTSSVQSCVAKGGPK